MWTTSQVISASIAPYGLRIGPLHYTLIAEDNWGAGLIAALSRHLAAAPDENLLPSTRIVHLRQLPEHLLDTCEPALPPAELMALLPADLSPQRWRGHYNRMNALWHADDAPHVLWVAAAHPDVGPLRFHLPWDMILYDLAMHGGGLIHGGLARHSDRALLFLAPPDGGKSTTLASAPPGWQVLSDDAALIWPVGSSGRWLASPLPSWTTLLSPETDAPPLLPAAATVPVVGLLSLHKSAVMRVEPLSQATAAPVIYRAMSEYPAVILADGPGKESLFRIACNLARQLPCCRLELPLGGDIWPKLQALICGETR